MVTNVFSQTTNLGEPFGWKNRNLKEEIPVIAMPGFDMGVVQSEDSVNDILKDAPWRFGYKYDAGFSAVNSGSWTELNNGNRLWRMQIDCKGAQTVNLLFENLYLPEGAYMYLYDVDKTNRVGAYTSRNNREDGLLGTELVHGDKLIVEYFEPGNVRGMGRFTISHVIHGYRSKKEHYQQYAKALNSSGDCQIDVNCPLGDGWEDQIRSVAMIVVGGNGYCTGALINNTCNDGTPYFLTANHCTNGANLGNWAFRFNWESPPGTESCATTVNSVDPGPPYDQTANGATLLVSGTQADHALIRIDNMTLTDAQNWNLFYAGWNNDDTDSPANISQGTGIHHPSGDVKKISRESNAPYHSTASGAQVWWIDSWEQGVTEPGSSGSPLFDQDGRIIGQLYGGAAACSGTSGNGQYDYYGRLGVSWTLGISDYLAPGTCGGGTTNNGWDPNATYVPDDAGIAGINEPNGLYCDSTLTPEIVLKNYGTNDLTSVIINYDIDNGTPSTYNWNGLLASGATTTLILNSIVTTSGSHTFNCWTTLPNGVADNDTSSDSADVSVTVEWGLPMQLALVTDCWGYENYWDIQDGSSTVVATGGNTIGIPPGGQQIANSGDPGSYGNKSNYSLDMCLTEGCYTFTIYDDYGDGMDGTSSGCSQDGSYTIYDGTMNILAGIQTINFGNSETVNFCLTDPCDSGNPPVPTVVSITPIVSNNGAIDISVSGGISPYTYDWSGPNGFSASTQDLSGLSDGGLYNVIVTDSTGCSTPLNNIAVNTSGLEELDNSLWNLYPNPTNGSFVINMNGAISNYDCVILDNTGRIVYSEQGVKIDKKMMNVNHLADGSYFVRITGAGFSGIKKIVISRK